MKFIITAGGQGTKLWPYSRADKPKHFQNILEGESLFGYNAKILLDRYKPEDIFVSTKKRYLKFIKEQAPRIPEENYVVEPDIRKNRGPAEGLAFLILSMRHPDEPFIIVQADCVRSPEEKYLEFIETAEKLAKKDKKFITGGIKAITPVLGVDFLKVGDAVKGDFKCDVFEINEYVNRMSDYEETKSLVENFNITTHCNHNCWYPDLMLEAYKKYHPSWYKDLMRMKDVIGTKNGEKEIEKIYSEMDSGPTEEVTKYVFPEGYVIIVPYKWSDIGTWNSLHEYFAKEGENYEEGKVLALDSNNNIIKSDQDGKLLATYGIENLVIVDMKDVLLVIPKDKIDKIKDIQKALEEKKDLNKFL
ncbi:sugar phosphate nucleotidyltransferase [Patescibacteria group bacterium]